MRINPLYLHMVWRQLSIQAQKCLSEHGWHGVLFGSPKGEKLNENLIQNYSIVLSTKTRKTLFDVCSSVVTLC